MTRTELRLADALDAAARGVREDTLRPLLVPQRLRRRAAWTAPAAAVASLLLVVGLAAVVAGYLPGSGRPGGAGSPPRYYVEAGYSGFPQVRSTASGAVTDTVRVPQAGGALVPYLLTAASNGVFFAAVNGPPVVRLYRFRLTAVGRVQGLRPVPGGALGSAQWAADAMAASPDGSQVAVSLGPRADPGTSICSSPSGSSCIGPPSDHSDHIYVVNTASGARSFWHGGTGQNLAVSVLSLSWTSKGNELAYFGQWCPQRSGNPACGARGTRTGGATAEVRALNPASGGGSLTSGRVLFSLSEAFPSVAQAVISPDGSTITAAALTGAGGRLHTPTALTVEQISIATRKPLKVLYRQSLSGAASINSTPDYATLIADATGSHWLFSEMNGSLPPGPGNLNGWIDGGQLMPLQPANGSVVTEAW